MKTPILLIRLIIIIIVLYAFCFWQNNSIVITSFNCTNEKIPVAFNDFKIVHISDLHNKEFGANQKTLLDKINIIAPDIIVITGDLIDRRRYDLNKAMIFINGIVDMAPVYYVSGNHEAWSGHFDFIKKTLIDAGVTVLDNEKTKITKGNSSINVLGLSDPAFLASDYMENPNTNQLKSKLNEWSTNKNFKILLSHRSEFFDLYAKNNMDIVFNGHAHGGQFRIPFIGAVFAPNQGLFPKYTSGRYSKDLSTMYVSRGLGNSLIPIRIFNRPEIIVVTLKNE